jgi:hypothetical protein
MPIIPNNLFFFSSVCGFILFFFKILIYIFITGGGAPSCGNTHQQIPKNGLHPGPHLIRPDALGPVRAVEAR